MSLKLSHVQGLGPCIYMLDATQGFAVTRWTSLLRLERTWRKEIDDKEGVAQGAAASRTGRVTWGRSWRGTGTETIQVVMIEEQGTEVTEDSEANRLLLQQFVDYVKLHKVVLIHLASEF
ncbi:hypothetical protein PsorP6_004443 [Peronosclerospora sorghi]|uniref:Uncharacterized protein n=1 Tax=Peronosclerospora sorghi TaxID=230839 RepID=A0ACC0VNJ4_9STRA|nr:hypothetical protein PsorP6_004443 [Peronosclerospora sorghi]